MATDAREANQLAAVRILVVDEVRLYREGLVNLLRQQAYTDEVCAIAHPDQALPLIRELQVSIVLFHTSTPEQVEELRNIVRNCSQTKVIAFGLSSRTDLLTTCAEAGAAGYLSRDASLDELEVLILAMVRGESLFSPRIVTTFLRCAAATSTGGREADRCAKLTRREREIVKHIDDGLSNKEIAGRLNIDVHTVKNHVHNILEKLQVHRRGEAAAIMRTCTPSVSW